MWVSMGVRSIRPDPTKSRKWAMPCLRTPSTSSIPNTLEPVNVSSLEYTGGVFPLGGAVHAELHEAPVGGRDATPDLQRLGGPDGVIDHFDAAGKGHGQSIGRSEHTARPGRDPLEHLKDRLVVHRPRPERLG